MGACQRHGDLSLVRCGLRQQRFVGLDYLALLKGALNEISYGFETPFRNADRGFALSEPLVETLPQYAKESS
jgi:hypothetical protein